jgi:catechol 2,3-dioxygenase-like lactoylglutathione lyase family enzyme
MPRIDAISVVSRDMQRTVAFYACLGFDFAGVDISGDHVEPRTPPGGIRLMIDGEALVRSLTGAEPRPASHSHFALLCDSPAEVDAVAARAAAQGFAVVREPWDAFWGQRYAVLADPDGYQVDLFAPL